MGRIKVVSNHNHNDPILIDRESIMPGDTATVKLNVGRLPSDTRLHVVAHIFRAKKPGPVVLLLGGVHGDEINGVEIVRRMIDEEHLDMLQRGTVIAIPLLNVYGFINFSRDVPDGKDVNRSFPGSRNGSVASRVASTLTKKILPYVDIAMDFHTGGSARYNYPQIRYTTTDKVAEKMAHVFGAPIIMQKPMITKSFRKICRVLDIPVIVYEAGESERLDGLAISKGIEGIFNILSDLKLLDRKVTKPLSMSLYKKSAWLRSPYSGLFIWSRQSGSMVTKGQPLGVIKDAFGTKSITVLSNRDGFIVGHNNASVVNQGDALFHIAFEEKRII